jgi:hypothetical protein
MHHFIVIRLPGRAVPSLGLSQEIDYLLGWEYDMAIPWVGERMRRLGSGGNRYPGIWQ